MGFTPININQSSHVGMKNIPGKISWTTSDVPDNVNDRIPEGGDGSTPP